jgi:hypothetical protein
MVGKGFWAIGNIGVSPDIRPEEAKHIQYFNIGMFLMMVINLFYFSLTVTDERTPMIIPIAQISTSVLCLLVYMFHKLGSFTTARIRTKRPLTPWSG